MDELLNVYTVPAGHPYYAKRALDVYQSGKKWKVRYRMVDGQKWDEYYDTELEALRAFAKIATEPAQIYCESEGEFFDHLSEWDDDQELLVLRAENRIIADELRHLKYEMAGGMRR